MENKQDPIIPIVGAALTGIVLAPVDPFISGTLFLACGVWGWKYYQEHSKLAGVFRNVGLVNADKQVLQLREKKLIEGGVMYRYSLPPGFCVDDVTKHQDAIEGFLGKAVTITTRIKDAVIEVYDDDIKQYDYEPTRGLEIGRGRGGKPVLVDFNRYPHLLIAGETGSGKSTLLRALITSMISQRYKLHLIDLKGGAELGIFRNSKSVVEFARTAKDAERVIALFLEEIDKRYDLFFERGITDIKSTKLTKQVLIIDEFAELVDSPAMKPLKSICARGRACGCNAVICTQRPSAKVIDGDIKANLTNVVGLKTINRVNSEVIGIPGLERLRGHGHGIFRSGGVATEFQAAWLSEDRARKLI